MKSSESQDVQNLNKDISQRVLKNGDDQKRTNSPLVSYFIFEVFCDC